MTRSKLKKRLAKRRRRARARRDRVVLYPGPEEPEENDVEIRLTIQLAPEAFARASEALRDARQAIEDFAPMVNELLNRETLPWLARASQSTSMGYSLVFQNLYSGQRSRTIVIPREALSGQAKLSPCHDCRWWHGRSYRGNRLICAMHPYGPDAEGCIDHEPETNLK